MSKNPQAVLDVLEFYTENMTSNSQVDMTPRAPRNNDLPFIPDTSGSLLPPGFENSPRAKPSSASAAAAVFLI